MRQSRPVGLSEEHTHWQLSPRLSLPVLHRCLLTLYVAHAECAFPELFEPSTTLNPLSTQLNPCPYAHTRAWAKPTTSSLTHSLTHVLTHFPMLAWLCYTPH